MKINRLLILFTALVACPTFANNYISANVEHAFRSSKLQTIHTKYLVRWDDYELLLDNRGEDFSDPGYYDSNNAQVETLITSEMGLRYVSNNSSTSISPTGRYIAFATEPSRSTADTRLRTNELYRYDRSLRSITQISSSEDSGNFRYTQPSVSDNGYVSYHRKPVGLTVERTKRKIFLYDPTTENTRMLGVECGYSLTSPPQDIYRYSLGGENSDMSGDGRYVVFQQFCYEADPAGGPDVDTFQTYLYDHVLETTTALDEVSDSDYRVGISLSGRFVSSSSGLYDQLKGYLNPGGRVDCIDHDGDGWGTVEASNAYCLVEGFESEYASCDYYDLVSGGYNQRTGEMCKFTKADSQSVTADNCVLGGESRNGFCSYPYTDNAFEFVRRYNDRVASNTTEPVTTGTIPLVTQQESTEGDCDYTNADQYDGWGWNAVLGESCGPADGVTDSTDSNSGVGTGDTATSDSETTDADGGESTTSTDDSSLPTSDSESGGGSFLELLLLMLLVLKNGVIGRMRTH